MMEIFIFGASSLAKQAYHYAVSSQEYSVAGFVVDEEYKTADKFLSLPVLTWSELTTCKTGMYVAVGYKSMRSRITAYDKVKGKGVELVNIVHQESCIADDVVMGINNFIMPGVVIEPGVKIGSNNIIWSNSTICHDTQIGSHNFIASNVTLGGEVKVGDNNFFGFSSTVVHQRTIGNENLISAGALIITDLDSLVKLQGVPAVKTGDLAPEIGVCVK